MLEIVKLEKLHLYRNYVYTPVNKNCEYIPTLGASYFTISRVNKNRSFNLDIWDTSGIEKFFSLIKIFCREADAILIFYNPYDVKSFERAKIFLNDCISNGKDNALKALVRGRYDESIKNNDTKNFVSDEEALEFADSNNLYFFHFTSFEKYETGFNEFLEILFNKSNINLGDNFSYEITLN